MKQIEVLASARGPLLLKLETNREELAVSIQWYRGAVGPRSRLLS